tara:strand:+ start:607 stop:2037 length:1431 start_codon:yes stop_codon:yes gene_type:complete
LQNSDYFFQADENESPPIELPFEFIQRDYQLPLWGAMFPYIEDYAPYAPENIHPGGATRIAAVWHRRAGKDKNVVNIILCKAVERPGLYLYALPTAEQARLVVWQGQDKDGVPFISHFPEPLIADTNESRMEVELTNGSIIKLIGADNFDRKMGSNPIGMVFSEYSIQNPMAWDYFRPILTENGGWSIFIYTPRGHNHGHTLYQRFKALALREDTKFFAQLLKNSETRAISAEAIQMDLDSGMSEEMAAQEYECDFDVFNAGIYFGRGIQRAYNEYRIVEFIRPDPKRKVYTFWDIGINDHTAIWFASFKEDQVDLLHYHEDRDFGMEHYIKYVRDWGQEKGVTFGSHYGPHDIATRDWSTAKTRARVAQTEYGFIFQKTDSAPLGDQIEAGRALWPKVRMSESTCTNGLSALSSWGKEWDAKRKVYRNVPAHDWSSHGASAFMNLAQQWREGMFLTAKPQQGKHPNLDIYNPLYD